MSSFARYIGIDYSGAATPMASLKGLRVYLAEGDIPPVEIPPPLDPQRPSSKFDPVCAQVGHILAGVIPVVGMGNHQFDLTAFRMWT